MFKDAAAAGVYQFLCLNVAAGLVGTVWLAVLGRWELVLLGIAFAVASPWLLCIVSLPSRALNSLTWQHFNRPGSMSDVFLFLSLGYTNMLVLGACTASYLVLGPYLPGRSAWELLPFLLWSWHLALSPWSVYPLRVPKDEVSAVALAVASMLHLLFLAGVLTGTPIAPIVVAAALVGFLALLPAWQVSHIADVARAARQRRRRVYSAPRPSAAPQQAGQQLDARPSLP